MCVQAAVACAKKIKTKTAISKTSVSVATLASNEAAKFKDGELNVLVIGATGKVGSTVVKNLLSHKGISVSVTSRKHNKNRNLCGRNTAQKAWCKRRKGIFG